jgi:hypothetical protein
MSRVLIPSEADWYDELKAVAYYGESDLEREIRQHVRSLFPDFHVFPFKTRITSRVTSLTNKPDLAMVRRDFKAWGVIEVELSEHDIRHVLQQTQCFVDGEYNAPEISPYIARQMERHCQTQVSPKRLQNLISNELPTVLVIADDHHADWENELKAAGVQLCIFQIFKSPRGRHIYRTCGAYPVVPARAAHCRRHASMDNVVEIIGHFEFKKLNRKREVNLMYAATLTRWKLMKDNGKNYLQFLGKVNPLSPKVTYRIFADGSHNYHLEIN